jgi:catechol 2,3-dioxygenase-like lactoylglutathione lyase family enzyme
MFPLEGLRSVDFVVPDLFASVDFYTRIWGLEPVAETSDAVWLRGTGDDPHVLALHSGRVAAISSMTFRARSDTDLAALAARAQAAGSSLVREVGPINTHGGGSGFAVRDPGGRTVVIVQGDSRPAPLAPRRDRPERLAHININSRDVDGYIAYLDDAFGFRLTDRSSSMGFVRTNADHHAVVIAEAGVDTLNHVAFLMPDCDGVMIGAARMIDAGYPMGWGPGRHGPGDNIFAYFVDPDGFVIEYTAEVLQVDDGYRVGAPRDWVWPPGRTDQWGIAPPKSKACKDAQISIAFADQGMWPPAAATLPRDDGAVPRSGAMGQTAARRASTGS